MRSRATRLPEKRTSRRPARARGGRGAGRSSRARSAGPARRPARTTGRTGRARRAGRGGGRNGTRPSRRYRQGGTADQSLGTGRAVILILLITVLSVAFAVLMAHEHNLAQIRDSQTSDQQKYDFNPGRIITDKKFFDSSAMTSTQVQAFLNEQGASCTSDMCLRSAAFQTRSVAKDDQCNGYEGGGKQSAAQIIDQTARSCRISQRALLVMLEKEQGLVRTTQPTERKYAAAMGLSCPDTAKCDATYSGFFNQVYGAAKRLRYYQTHPDEYNYHAGRVNTIAYSPDSSCGTGQVYIENTATALLYIYTPYQPDTAALTGRFGDRCSSYGNLNFRDSGGCGSAPHSDTRPGGTIRRPMVITLFRLC